MQEAVGSSHWPLRPDSTTIHEENTVHHIASNAIVKLVHVVRDIEQKVEAFATLFGIPRPEIIATTPPPPQGKAFTEFRGTRITGRVKLANVPMGAVVLELIQPVDEESPWAEYLAARGEGIFSVVCSVDRFEEHMALMNARGMPLYHLGEYGSGRYSYYKTLDSLGITLCLQNLERKPD
jgi:methylmalonyl-CoA/ethylmalonyl-CoA epimerase